VIVHKLYDDSKFTIDGRKREYGEEKPCVVHIEQNEQRAFLITSIEQPISHQQKNQERMKSEALEGTVRPKDALDIKNFLQEEKEMAIDSCPFRPERTV